MVGKDLLQKIEIAEEAAAESTTAGRQNNPLLVSSIAHEINNPLAVIQGYSELLLQHLKQGKVDLQLIQKHLLKIQNTSLRIGKIVNGLREISENRRQGDSETVPIQTLIEDTLLLCLQKTKAINAEVSVRGDVALLVTCFSWQLVQVLNNIINNACDALSETKSPWIRIDYGETSGGISICVTDNGPGIPEELRGRIFEPFYTSKGHGSGVGLSICKQLMESSGGQIYIDEFSSHTRFVVTIPKSDDLKVVSQIPALPELSKPKNIISPEVKDATILLVDDEPEILEMMSTLFEPVVSKVLTARDSIEAIAAYKAHFPDIVLSDIVMPGENGIALARHIRNLGFEGLFCLVSGSVFQVIDEAIDAGANAIYKKPFEFGDLLSSVSSLHKQCLDHAGFKSRRAHDRFKVNIPLRAVFNDSAKTTIQDLQILELSVDGARLLWSEDQPKVGEVLALRIYLSEQEIVGVIPVETEVRWCNTDIGQVGIQFRTIKDSDKTLLQEYLNLVATQPNQALHPSSS